METVRRTYLAVRHRELREAKVWVKAWFDNPVDFAVTFMAAAIERESNAESGETGKHTRAG
jgi:hypothetical protein